MPRYRRGNPLPINQALNRSRAKLGLTLPTWMTIAFVAILIFLAGFRFTALLAFQRWPPAPGLSPAVTPRCSTCGA